jgi:hypothetical protein
MSRTLKVAAATLATLAALLAGSTVSGSVTTIAGPGDHWCC